MYEMYEFLIASHEKGFGAWLQLVVPGHLQSDGWLPDIVASRVLPDGNSTK